MVKIYVTKTCSCPTKSTLIKSSLQSYLQKNGVNDGEISVAIVGRAKMISLAKKYLKEKNTVHNVLSFTDSEVSHRFVRPPGVTYLGEIVICYPKVIEEANLLDKRVDDRVIELAEHGALHLLGIHHE